MGKKGIIPWNFDDLTGRRFGRLTVVQKASKKSSNTTRWLCLCDCGNINNIPTMTETEIQRLKDNWKGEL